MLNIDALRAIAAILVVWLHSAEVFINLSPQVKKAGSFLFDVAWDYDFGRIGVVIFFAISGFVIPSSLRGNRVEGSIKFAIRRLLRLYPAFWLSIPLGLASVWWIWNKPTSPEMIAANLTMTPILFNQTQIMGHYWTLETELVFYLFCWLLFIFGILKNPITLFTVPILLLCAKGILAHQAWFAPLPGQWRTMPYHLAIMFWGALYRNWKDNPTKKIPLARNIPWTAIPLSLLLLALTAAILSPTILATYQLSLNGNEILARYASSYLLGISIFILGTHCTKLGTRHLAYLGKISYSIYLFHPTAFYTILWVIKKESPPTLQHQHISFYIMLTMITTISISSLIYSTIEEPFIKISHKITKNTNLFAPNYRQTNHTSTNQ